MKRLFALLAVMALLLAGCVRIPSSGPVTAADAGDVTDRGGVEFIAESPALGASPEAIIQGFLFAGVSPDDDYAVAREYLTGPASTNWDPRAGVLVRSGQPQISMTGDATGEVAVSIASRVDGRGIMHHADESTQILSFELQQVDGEWRLSQVPEGVLLSLFYFERLFQSVPIQWYSPDGEHFVPDLRWFPNETQTLTRDVVDALIDAPATWLQSSVLPSAASGASVVGEIVDRPGGGISFTLNTGGAGALTEQELSRFALQVQRSLGTSGVVEVQLQGAEEPIGSSSAAIVPATDSLWPSPLLYRDGEVRIAQSNGAVITGLGERLSDLGASSYVIVPGIDEPRIGAAYARGGIYWINDDEPVQIGEEARTDPSVDRFRTVWWVDNSEDQRVHAWVEGERRTFDVELGGERVSSVEVSPEGSRLAIVTTSPNTITVRLFAVVRSGAVPEDLRLGPELSTLGGSPVDIVWNKEDSLAIVSAEDSENSALLLLLDGSTRPLVLASVNIREIAPEMGGGGIIALSENGSLYTMAPGRSNPLAITDVEFLIS